MILLCNRLIQPRGKLMRQSQCYVPFLFKIRKIKIKCYCRNRKSSSQLTSNIFVILVKRKCKKIVIIRLTSYTHSKYPGNISEHNISEDNKNKTGLLIVALSCCAILIYHAFYLSAESNTITYISQAKFYINLSKRKQLQNLILNNFTTCT